MGWTKNLSSLSWLNKHGLNIKIKEIARRPECQFSPADPTVGTNQVDGDESSLPSRFNGSNAIYELIGSGGTTGANPPRETGTNDLIGALHMQYCCALNDPEALLGVEWITPSPTAHESLPDLRLDGAVHVESIETLLSGVRSVEDMFGLLAAGDLPDPAAVTTAPEILRLFAPPEFNASTSRLPPTLVRREHHAVGIDSPLMTRGVSTVTADSSTDA